MNIDAWEACASCAWCAGGRVNMTEIWEIFGVTTNCSLFTGLNHVIFDAPESGVQIAGGPDVRITEKLDLIDYTIVQGHYCKKTL